jgi:putative transposase
MLKIKPLREPRANKISTTVFFFSKKLGRQVWCESNAEWDVAILLDHALFVVDYCEQGIELEWSKSKWIPDFVLLFKNGDEYVIFIIEVKYLKDLIENREEFRQKYMETREWIKVNTKKLASRLTDLPVKKVEFLVVTDQIINQSFRTQNLRKLMQATVNVKYYVEIQKHVKAILSVNPRIELNNLVQAINMKSLPDGASEDDVWTVIYAMIYHFELFIDLESLFTTKSAVYDPTRLDIDYESIDTWLKKYNWEEQENYNNPAIPLVDLYGIMNDPSKSIELWEEANRRLRIIKPLIGKPIKELKQMKFEKDWQTIYRWILAYTKSGGDIRSLIPKYNERGRKNLKGDDTQELWKYGLEQYKKREKKSIRDTYKLMRSYALNNNKLDKIMSYSTFWRKIRALHPKEIMKSREGENKSEKLFELSESEFPHGDFPLQSVQVDHTPIDVMIVDEEHRLVTERPYLTVAFDSNTRCVIGYYITYDDPSRLSIAMTLMNCIQNKGETLGKVRKQFPDLDQEKLELIESSGWKYVYGLPFTLHMDNGSDFTSNDIILFGYRYKIHLHYRAVKKAQHGAYVERYLGTLNKRLHGISGTTQSNVYERGDYPSEKKAIYTIGELEARIISELVIYHDEYHSSIRTTPLAKWRENFSLNCAVRGINRNIDQINLATFKFDVLPSELRTVQKSGVEIFNLHYAHDDIGKWVGVKNPNDRRKSRKFRIRYDPRDIRTIWFYDDDAKNYIPLACNNRYIQTFFKNEPITLWDWKAINKEQVIAGNKEEKTEQNLRILNAQLEMDKTVSQRTKSARQKQAKRSRRKNDEEEFLRERRGSSEEHSQDEIDPEVFMVTRPERVKIIKIPPKDANPFYGITKKKAKEMATK